MFRNTLLSSCYVNKNRKRKLLISAISILNEEKRIKRRSCQVRKIFQNRNQQGAFQNLVVEMRLNDPYKYYNYHRMSCQQFDQLLRLVGPNLIKNDRFRSDVISPAERLSTTLRYLASGDEMLSISYLYRTGASTVSEVVRDTCLEIWRCLKEVVLKKPSKDVWLQIARDFEEQWNFPNCIGALDGKHILIKAPPHTGSTYFNYKGSHSIVLLATCDANYCFTLVDIGAQGRQSDGGIFRNSLFGKKFYGCSMDVPESRHLHPGGPKLPFVLVGDQAFQLTDFLMRPYPGRDITREDSIYNYRLSRARRTIENTFGLLTAKWRIFRKPINASIKTIEAIVLATVCLHNYLKRDDVNICNQRRKYCPYNWVDRENDGHLIPGQWRQEVSDPVPYISDEGADDPAPNAADIRDAFKEHFLNEGAIPWQWDRNMYN